MLGQDLVCELEARGWHVTPLDHEEMDVADPLSVAKLATGGFGQFDWCFNCAAYTAVDRAEEEHAMAFQVNALGAGYIAGACTGLGARLLHVSTDFVFDGRKQAPYVEADHPHPLSIYGKSKLAGEEAVLGAAASAVIVRTSWLYGPKGNSFARTIIRAWRSGRPLKVVADQEGCPTYTADLARVLADIAAAGLPGGFYHAAGPQAMTWHSFAELVIGIFREQLGPDAPPANIAPIATADWPTPAQRPSYSVLSFEKLLRAGIAPMRATGLAVKEFCQRLGIDGV